MPVVTIGEVKAALKVTLGRRGMSDDEVDTLADYLISFFGFDSEVIDNRLDVADRDVFYMLEEEGLLGTRQEEIHIKRGKLWRIHYWVLRADRIKALAAEKGDRQDDSSFAFYDEIPEEVWARH